MALSALDDKSQTPSEEALTSVLGTAKSLWDDLKAGLEADFGPLAESWVFSGKKWGWALRLKRKKRAILYLTPCRGFFLAGFALGAKAVDAAHESDLPPSVLELIDSAPRYAEGRGVRLEVRTAEDVRNALGVAAVKMAN